MTLKLNRVLEVVEVDVRAKSHQAACSCSRVIVVAGREENSDENNTVRRYRVDSKYCSITD